MVLLDNESANEELADLQRSYGIELAYRYQPFKRLGLLLPLRIGNMDVGEFENKTFYSADLLLRLSPLGGGRAVSPYLAAGYGYNRETDRPAFGQIPLSAGVDLRLGDNVTMSVRGEYRQSEVDLRDNLNLSVGYVVRFTGADADGDRIPNSRDRCPNTPGSASAEGCPDADGDGVQDQNDNCPSEGGSPEAGGCPDTDSDGIPDREDQCPYEPGRKRLRGCPDIDNDGVPDDIDQCPNVPGSLYSGCPDSDGDGFEDQVDDCPDIAGSNRGCPEVTPELQERLDLASNQFRFNGRNPTLDPASYPILNDLAKLILDNPGFVLGVETHTDNSGGPVNNEYLTEQRALAIRGYLMSKGVSPELIRTAYYGATRPKADNGTAVGRELNNRVEFVLIPR